MDWEPALSGATLSVVGGLSQSMDAAEDYLLTVFVEEGGTVGMHELAFVANGQDIYRGDHLELVKEPKILAVVPEEMAQGSIAQVIEVQGDRLPRGDRFDRGIRRTSWDLAVRPIGSARTLLGAAVSLGDGTPLGPKEFGFDFARGFEIKPEVNEKGFTVIAAPMLATDFVCVPVGHVALGLPFRNPFFRNDEFFGAFIPRYHRRGRTIGRHVPGIEVSSDGTAGAYDVDYDRGDGQVTTLEGFIKVYDENDPTDPNVSICLNLNLPEPPLDGEGSPAAQTFADEDGNGIPDDKELDPTTGDDLYQDQENGLKLSADYVQIGPSCEGNYEGEQVSVAFESLESNTLRWQLVGADPWLSFSEGQGTTPGSVTVGVDVTHPYIGQATNALVSDLTVLAYDNITDEELEARSLRVVVRPVNESAFFGHQPGGQHGSAFGG